MGGFGDLADKFLGNKPADIPAVDYHGTGTDYVSQQNTAQGSIGQGQQNLGAAANQYQQTLAGHAPSLAAMQLQQGQQQAAQQAMGLASSARGTGNQLLAQQNAQQQNAMGQQQTNAQSAMLRAQETQAATQGLAGIGAQQQGMGQQYGLGANAQNVSEREAILRANMGTQRNETEARMKASGSGAATVSGVMGGLGAIAGKCCAPDTLILTPSGERRIDSIEAGDLVYTVGHKMVKVLEARSTATANHRVMRVALSSGSVLEISPGHPTADGRTFGELRTGDHIDGVRVEYSELVPYGHARTFDILPDDPTGTYYAGGIRIGSTLRGL